MRGHDIGLLRPGGYFNTSYAQEMALIRTPWQWGLFLFFLLFLAAFPLKPAPLVFFLHLVESIPILGEVANYDMLIVEAIVLGYTAIAVLGLQLMFGYAGQVSFGHVGFMAVGATMSFLLVGKLGVNFFLALPLVVLVSALTGALVGAFSLRVKDWYLGMVTFAAFFIIMYLLGNISDMLIRLGVLSPGSSLFVRQAPRPSLGGFVFGSDVSYYYLVVGLTALMTALAKNIVRTRIGRAFIAIRDNEIAAEVTGIPVARYKILAFALGCAYAGIAGALYAHYVTFIASGFFQFNDNLWLLSMVVIGGRGSILGAILGTLFVRLLFLFTPLMVHQMVALVPPIGPLEARLSSSAGLMAVALALILFLVFEPRGLAYWWQRFKAYYRLYPFSY